MGFSVDLRQLGDAVQLDSPHLHEQLIFQRKVPATARVGYRIGYRAWERSTAPATH